VRRQPLALAHDDDDRTHPLLRELARLFVLRGCVSLVPAAPAMSDRARTFELRRSSITRRSYGEKPATSRMTERTNVVFALATPFRWLGRTACAIAVVGWPLFRP
jgi:hypothetical protein